jgi:hypothetical protein
MVDPVRLLGFAFANADLLFETDREGKILFATGATKGISTQTPDSLRGQMAGRLFAPNAAKKFTSLSRSLNPGGRLVTAHSPSSSIRS